MSAAWCSRERARAVGVVALGVVFVAFGLGFGFGIRARVEDEVRTASQFCGDGDATTAHWRTNTRKGAAAKFVSYFAFNATNAKTFLEQPPGHPEALALNMVGQYTLREYDTRYDVEWGPKASTAAFRTWKRFEFVREESCSVCQQLDLVTNFSPSFLHLLTTAGSEMTLGLLLSRGDLAYRHDTVCTAENIPHSLQGNCTTNECCCNIAAPYSDRTNCRVRASSLLSEIASFDGGVAYRSPLIGPTVSPLFVTKTVYETKFGYPSALAGMAEAFNAATTRNITLLGMMANYTQLAHLACNFSTTGFALSPDELAGTPYQFLADISCSPLQATKYWADFDTNTNSSRCAAIAVSTASPACQCVNADHGEGGLTTPTRPCCTLTGLGCLAKVPGYVSDELYLTEEQARDFDVTDGTKQNTGCGDFKSGEEFWWTLFEQRNATPTWAQNTRPLYSSPSQPEVYAATQPGFSGFTNIAPVAGSDGTRSEGTGRTSRVGSYQLSNGKPKSPDMVVFVTELLRATRLYFKGSEDYRGVTVARFEPSRDMLSQHVNADYPGTIDNGVMGAGTPYSGLQDVTFTTGFPVFVSKYLFLDGDASLMTNDLKITKMGMEPRFDREFDESYVLVEPASGMTLLGHKRLMTSFALYNCTNPELQACNASEGGLVNLGNPYIPSGKIVPQYFIDETSEATQSQMEDLKSLLQLSQSADVLLIVLPCLGFLVALCGLRLLRSAPPGASARASLLAKQPNP